MLIYIVITRYAYYVQLCGFIQKRVLHGEIEKVAKFEPQILRFMNYGLLQEYFAAPMNCWHRKYI